MTRPAGLPSVTVSTGPHTDFLGVPYSGTVTITPSTSVIWAATGAVLLDGPITTSLDAAGAATIVLPPTDASGLTVQGFTYTVAFNLKSASGATAEILPIIIQLPQAAPTVDLDLLVSIVSSTGITVGLPAVVSVAGLSGAPTAAALKTALSLGTAAYTAATAYDPAGAAITAVVGLAPLASPTFTGTPAGPTATAGTNTTQLASTAFVAAALAALDGGTL